MEMTLRNLLSESALITRISGARGHSERFGKTVLISTSAGITGWCVSRALHHKETGIVLGIPACGNF